MSNENIIKVGYFNINDKKNSILENASHQDNNLTEKINQIENLTKNIKIDFSKKDEINNLDTSINFKKKNK